MTEQSEIIQRHGESMVPFYVLRVVREALAEHEEREQESVEILRREVAAVSEKLDEVIIQLNELASIQNKFESAFLSDAHGGPDFVGHFNAHSAMVEESLARREFWRKLGFELAKYSLFGLIGWMAAVLWKAFIAGPR